MARVLVMAGRDSRFARLHSGVFFNQMHNRMQGREVGDGLLILNIHVDMNKNIDKQEKFYTNMNTDH